MIERLLRAIFPLSFLHKVFSLYLFIDTRERSAATGYIFHDGKILLVRQSYGGGGWTYPGGFLNKNEVPETGLRREAYEETGLVLSRVKLLEKTPDTRKGHNVTIYRFYAEVEAPEVKIDQVEIVEARWVPISKIGEFAPHDRAIEKAVELYNHYEHNI